MSALLTAAMLLAQVPAGLLPDAIDAFASAAAPNLNVTAFTASSSVAPGGTASYSWTVANTGDALATSSPLWGDQVWLCPTATYSTTCAGAGGIIAPNELAAGASYNRTFSATISSATTPGNYYFILQTDSSAQVAESNETDNFSAAVPVTVAAPARERIAYVYSADTAARDSFATFLSAEGFAVDALTITAAETADLSAYRAIVISDDSGDLGSWGTPAAVANIGGSGKRVVGVGEGGYAYFGRKYAGAVGTIGWGNGAHGTASSVKVVNATDPAWTTPNALGVANGTTLALYSAGVTSVEIFDETASKGHRYIGQHAINARYYNVIAQSPTSCDVLWGFSGSPDLMTAGGKALFENLLSPCGAQPVTVSAEVREDSNANGTFDAGEPLVTVPTIEVWRLNVDGVRTALAGSAANSPNISVSGIEAGRFEIEHTLPTGYESASANPATVTVGSGGSSSTVFLVRPASGGITGIARCGDTTLPGATVELLSGSALLETTTANEDAFYSFADVSAGATYTIRITGSYWLPPPPGSEFGPQRFVTCGIEVTVGADGSAAAPAGATIPNRLNHTWTTAYDITQGGSAGAYTTTLTDYVFTEGQSTWFKFPVREGQHVTVNVTDVPADYSVTLYKDIRKLYLEQQALINADPLANVDIIDGSVAPDALSPDALSPDALSPDALSPDALSPDALSPDALSPDALSPDALSPEVYASAQMAALIGVSAHVGLSPERIARNTWGNSGYFYVRVRGHNGVFDVSAPFTLTVKTVDSACAGVALPTFPSIATGGFSGMKTVILTNSARLGSDAAFAAKLSTLAAHSRVQGVVVDLAGVADGAYTQWDAAKLCPAAANAIAQGIRGLVGAYRAQYPTIEHVVLVGGDHVIPFFRTPDQSGLGNERDYAPPVGDDTASQASLKLGYVLTQDPYGARTPFSRFDHELYIAELGVGRLVETAAQITPVIDAFIASGGVIAPQHALVTGYDFLSDAALAIGADLVAGGITADQSLIQPVGDGPTAPTAWTADQLRAKLLAGPRADIVALNGHFSANRALAADYATRLGSEEVAALTDGRFVNTLVLSTGCHSGYNIVDGHAVPLTQPVDFPQAFALQGATLVGGTGYQYGDTDFIKYSELIHQLLVREMRYGGGPVNVGTALANAKRAYVSQLAALRGIDEKALAEATLYGLPMTAVDLPTRIARPGGSLGGSATALTTTLGAVTWNPSYTLDRNAVTLTATDDGTTSTAVYYDIDGNVAVSPGTPVLPLLTQNVERSGTAARGVVLLGAQYQDEAGVLPFTNVAVTEVRAAHPQYTAEVFTPVRPFSLNHFAGTTLVTTPFQFRSDPSGVTGTARTLTQPAYKIYYSSSTDPGVILASSPVVYAVHLTPVTGGVRVDVIAGAAASVGIQELFATYTGDSGALYGSWTSLALVEDLGTRLTNVSGVISTYSATILTADPTALRVLVQAVAGNGLVTAATNNGAYYRVVTETATAVAPKVPTQLALSAPASVPYLGTASVSATLTSGGAGLAGRTVSFRSGDVVIDAVTNASGVAAAALPITTAPGAATVSVGFIEDASYLPSGAEAMLTVTRAATRFTGDAPPLRLSGNVIIGSLLSGTRPLGDQPIEISGGGHTVATFTDGYGRVRFDSSLGFPEGGYLVTVEYAGNDRFQAVPPTVLLVVYDPEAAITGGGWIPTAGLRSNFAFTVRYGKDGSTATGSVEYHARDGEMTVKSTSIAWLAASGGRADISGTATVNEVAGYTFRVRAIDGSPDRFEVKVFDASGTEIYAAAADLGGGSVTVR